MSTPPEQHPLLDTLNAVHAHLSWDVPPPDPRVAIADVLDALTHLGVDVALPVEPSPAPTEADYEAMARWLADRSSFPRYLVQDGWRRLLESDRDVDLAHSKASARYGQSDEAAAVRQHLLDRLQRRAGS